MPGDEERNGRTLPDGGPDVIDGTGTFWETLGCVLEEAGPDGVTVSLAVEPRHLNHLGILHGGVYASVIDSAMGIAAMRERPGGRIVTVQLGLHYTAPVRSGKLIVTAKILHASRSQITARAYARKENGELCAYGTGSFRVLGPRPPTGGSGFFGPAERAEPAEPSGPSDCQAAHHDIQPR